MNKPIGDFETEGGNNLGVYIRLGSGGYGFFLSGGFGWLGGGVGVVVNGVLISELEEYALEFGLVALGFVLFPHRRMMHGKRQGEGKVTAGVGAARSDLWGREV